MFTSLRSMIRDPEGKIILVWAAAQILLGMLVYMWLEDWSWINALYFSVVTLATVGFGDLHPTTDASKLFTIVYIIFGLGILAAFITELTKHRSLTIARVRSHLDGAGTDAPSGAPGASDTPPTTQGRPDED